MVSKPSNADLQRQILSLREDNKAEHEEVKRGIIAINSRLDAIVPSISSNAAKLQTLEEDRKSVQDQIRTMTLGGITVTLAIAGWIITHLMNSAKQ